MNIVYKYFISFYYFNFYFKKTMKLTPTEYRKNFR